MPPPLPLRPAFRGLLAKKTASSLHELEQRAIWAAAGKGEHTEEIQAAIEDDLLKYACDNFTGTKAKSCHKKEANFIQ